MAAFFLGVLLGGLVFGTIAYNCYGKREIVERSLRGNIETLEYNIAVLRKESELKIETLEGNVIKAKEDNKKAVKDIDMLNKDITSLKKQLEQCKKELEEC
ncbi:MAG: hypothetical protein GY765_22340 [bacterium]|nr:hypothetical protein [bacterium]